MSNAFVYSTKVDLSFTVGVPVTTSIWTVSDSNAQPVDLSNSVLSFSYSNSQPEWQGVSPVIHPVTGVESPLVMTGNSLGAVVLSNSTFESVPGSYAYTVTANGVEVMHGILRLQPSLSYPLAAEVSTQNTNPNSVSP